MAERANLTEERIRALPAPATGETVLWDAKLTGFGVRCFPSGRKVYILMYRPAGGRSAPKRRMTLGEFEKVKLGAARTAAQNYLGQIANGGDPQADRKSVALRQAARLDHALESYDDHLKRRQVVNREQVIRNLRRYLPGPAVTIDLASLDRQAIAQCIAKIEKQSVQSTSRTTRAKTKAGVQENVRTVKRRVGGVGAAADFRTKAHTFFSWAANRGLIYANPLAGWRRDRTTRAEMTSRPGRALTADELKAVWLACDDVPAPYGSFVRLLILTGQRRTETALVRWSDVDTAGATWTIPAAVAKNGRRHVVPLPAAVLEQIQAQERLAGTAYVFAGRKAGSAISNWSKRQADLVVRSGVEFTLHDLRRTFRSGLRLLGIDTELAEMMLNHSRAELIEIYDREPRMAERAKAAAAWSDYVAQLVRSTAEV